MTDETHGTPDYEPEEEAHLAHRAWKPMWVMVAAAATLTGLRGQGMPFVLGAIAAWLLTVMFFSASLSHRWDVCSYCDAPPRQVATPDARLRLARRVHSKLGLRARLLPLVVLVAAAVLPKPYLRHAGWWGPVAVGVVCLLTAVSTILTFRDVGLHINHRSECPNEWCRSDRSRRHPNAWQRAVAHYGVWALLVLVPAMCAIGVLALVGGMSGLAYPAAMAVVLYVMSVMLRFHANTPCLICAKRLPSNGGDLAEKRSPWLRAWHSVRYVLAGTAMALWVASWVFSSTVGGRVLLGVAALTLVGQLVLNRVHSRLQPWCPWCREGGEDTTTATPDPARSAPVPA